MKFNHTNMGIFLWLFQFISPFCIIIGGLYLFENPNPMVILLGILSALVGAIVGVIGWLDTIPPRWFWIKSNVDLAGSRVLTTIGYAIQFFFIPPFVAALI